MAGGGAVREVASSVIVHFQPATSGANAVKYLARSV
jgi:hypothetical protein